jgi:predicted transcriptional regulator
MASAKETMTEIIARQPDDSSYDEILRELAFARMVERGLEDSDAGRTISDDDVKRKIESWREHVQVMSSHETIKKATEAAK